MTTDREAPLVTFRDAAVERALVGACLVTPAGIDAALDEGLEASHFFATTWGDAFQALCAVHLRGEAVDAITVAEEVARLGLAAPDLMQLEAAMGDHPPVSAVGSYARMILDHSQRRAILGAAIESVEIAKGPGSAEEVAAAVDAMITSALSGQGRRSASETIGVIADRVIERLLSEQSDAVPSGFRELDRLLGGGFDPGALVIVGARPSMGKTSFALGIARRVAGTGRRALFVSVEQGASEIGLRLLSDVSKIPAPQLRPPAAPRDLEHVRLAASVLADLPLVIEEGASTLSAIAREARRLARSGGLGLVVVDYLQLILTERGERREREVADLSRGLKALARDLACPVIALSQLNRLPEARADKRPNLADLRESGAIEQDADVVALLYRDEVYDSDTVDRGIAELHVAKHRNGPTGVVRMAFLAERMAFVDLSMERER